MKPASTQFFSRIKSLSKGEIGGGNSKFKNPAHGWATFCPLCSSKRRGNHGFYTPHFSYLKVSPKPSWLEQVWTSSVESSPHLGNSWMRGKAQSRSFPCHLRKNLRHSLTFCLINPIPTGFPSSSLCQRMLIINTGAGGNGNILHL